MRWQVVDFDGEVIGYSEGETQEEAFYNFNNGALLLSDLEVRFIQIDEEGLKMREATDYKLKVGDKVNPNSTYLGASDDSDFAVWKGATVVEILPNEAYPYRCICDHFGSDEPGLFAENELELA